MLRLRDIRKTRGRGSQRYSLLVPALNLAAGQQFALVGPSGSGKSTLLDLLALVLAPDPGGEMSLRVADREIDLLRLWRDGQQERLAELRSREIGYVLQTGGLLGYLDVRRNIGLSRALLGLPQDDTVPRLARQLEISEQLDKRPAALSVGQRQRVGIARALAHGPRLLLADEPTASLDPLNARRVLELLLEQSRSHQAGLLLSTHDPQLALSVGLQLLQLRLRRDDDGGVTAILEAHG
jgi:putative ABC transport system ATP-binding protein